MLQRLRNALRRGTSLSGIRHVLITRIGKEHTFRTEGSTAAVRRGPVPPEYLEFVAALRLSGSKTFESAKAIAWDIAKRRRLGDGLSRDSVSALRLICEQQGGICSDISQVFTGLCLAAGIPVREWGIEEDLGTEKGHSFNEVFATEFGKWVFLDASKTLFATTKGSASPLSASEVIDKVSAGWGHEVEMTYFGPPEKREEALINVQSYYFNPTNVFFLLSNNNPFRQDLFLRWAHAVPLALIHAVMLVSGRYPRFEIYTNSLTRQGLTERLRAHKQRLGGMLRQLARALSRA
jgi:hypothetical protein